MNTGFRMYDDLVVATRAQWVLREELRAGVYAGIGSGLAFASLGCGLRRFNAGMYFRYITLEAICDSRYEYADAMRAMGALCREPAAVFCEAVIDAALLDALAEPEIYGRVVSTSTGGVGDAGAC